MRTREISHYHIRGDSRGRHILLHECAHADGTSGHRAELLPARQLFPDALNGSLWTLAYEVKMYVLLAICLQLLVLNRTHYLLFEPVAFS